MTEFGTELCMIRRARGLSQRTLARKLQLSPSVISEIERGAHYPSFETLLSLSRTLKLRVVFSPQGVKIE